MIVPSDTWGEVSRVGGDKWEPDTRQKFSFNSLSILHLKDENKAGYSVFQTVQTENKVNISTHICYSA